MSARNMSERGRALLAEWEGIRLSEYRDSAGNPTIGVGHLIRYDEEQSGKVRIGDRRVPYKDGLSLEDVMALLGEDLRWAEEAVATHVHIPLEQRQFDALVSFTFNEGASRFIDSTLLRCLNAGHFEAIPAQFERWIYAGGKADLKQRRANEIALWEGKL